MNPYSDTSRAKALAFCSFLFISTTPKPISAAATAAAFPAPPHPTIRAFGLVGKMSERLAFMNWCTLTGHFLPYLSLHAAATPGKYASATVTITPEKSEL